jgi:hypothetical protein
MKYFEPEKLENGNYLFSEDVNGGYINRGQCAYYNIKTEWNDKLELIFCAVDDDIYTKYFNINGKFNNKEVEKHYLYHFNRMKLGINRHLKYLKIYLGHEKLQEEVTIPVFYRGWWPNTEVSLTKVVFSKAGTPKIDGYRTSFDWVRATEEKAELVDQYNKLVRDYLKAEKELRAKIFDK